MDFSGTTINVPDGWQCEQVGDRRYRGRLSDGDGAVDVLYYALMPGVVLLDIDLRRTELPAFNPMGSSMFIVNWCAQGRCEVDFGERGSAVVDAQTLCLSSTVACSFAYPTGRYRGFELFVDLDQIAAGSWAFLELLGIGRPVMQERLLKREKLLSVKTEGELSDAVVHMEAELASSDPRLAQLVLDTYQLLYLLATLDLDTLTVAGSYLQRGQRDMARAVHHYLQHRMSPVANLAPLAQELGVSEASLRNYFGRVYGTSPAAFARARALERAEQLLSQTDSSVADIATACGYANPSKFASAFARAYGATPLEYRRRAWAGGRHSSNQADR